MFNVNLRGSLFRRRLPWCQTAVSFFCAVQMRRRPVFLVLLRIAPPGPIDTPIWSSLDLPKEVVEQIKKQIVSMVPANEMRHTEDIAKAALFLASNDGKFIRGIELFVDGGMASV
ncbi:MAG TPA: SDR family oxidoreductase [Bryobacteraceae bacterium]|nr:SDR family oxidoreductase [Bryobacteraceae bacterium]